MKPFLLTVILTIFYISVVAGQGSGIKLGVSLIPEVSRSFIQKGNSPYSFHSRLSSAGKFGLQIQKPLSKKFHLRTGLLYELERYNVDIYNIYLESNNFASETEIKEEVQLGSLLIPLQILYRFNDHWAVFSGLGVELPFFDQRYRYIMNGGEEEPFLHKQDREIKKSWMAFSLGFSRTMQRKFLNIEFSPQLWFHTHRSQIPLQARTHFQMTAGLELTAWLL